MEQEGIFYFFGHEEQEHTLVLFDTLQKCKPSALRTEPLRFAPQQVGTEDWGEVMSSWQKVQTLAPGKCTLRDHHFVVPRATLEASQPTLEEFEIGGNSALEVYDYPGEYAQKFYDSTRVLETPSPLLEEASRVASLRIQEEESPNEIFTGSSDCRGLEVGCSFELIGHDSMDSRYVVTALQHSVAQNPPHTTGRNLYLPYSNTMRCLLFGRSFRPARITLRPVVQGPQTAVVVGKSGDEILVDKYGRVKVQFFWDRNGNQDENSSCWLRVAQPWAGSGFGAIFIPRVGQEVLVDFLEGDPDQPIVIGSLYNADQTVPYTLPDYQMVSGIRTRSTKGGGQHDANVLTFDDTKGQEVFYVRAQKDMYRRVENNDDLRVGSNQTENIGSNRTTTIGRNDAEKVGLDQSITIGTSQTVKVGTSQTNQIGTTQDNTIGTSQTTTIGATKATTVAASETHTVGGMLTVTAGGIMNVTVGGVTMVTSGGPLMITAPVVLINGVLMVTQPIIGATAVVSPAYTPGLGNLI